MRNEKLIEAIKTYGKHQLATDSNVPASSIHMILYSERGEVGYSYSARIAKCLGWSLEQVKPLN
jgi:hypothetical protein